MKVSLDSVLFWRAPLVVIKLQGLRLPYVANNLF